ncbi:hypothetical protein [uncultured Fusobacterium sp.]|uniref:hypothetical protein n=1 Tax=uncultured Fusobacterium sp. TaxID=159267 RepID=UPI0027DAD2FC|nr:hypothetical protein [uncultured Fusobacterium sp.]
MKVKFIRNYKGFKKGDIEEIINEEELIFLDKTKTIEKLGKEIKLNIPVEEEIIEEIDENEKIEEDLTEKIDKSKKIEEDLTEKIDKSEKTEDKVTEKNKNKKK